MKKYFFLLLLMLPLFFATGFMKREKPVIFYQEYWSGDIHFSYTMIDKGKREEAGTTSEWNDTRDASVIIHVTNNKGHAYVNDIVKKYQKITIPVKNAAPSVQIIKSHQAGGGSGDVTVWVEMEPQTGKYWLKTDGPPYPAQRQDSMIQTFAGTPIIQSGSSSAVEENGFPIDAPDQLIGKNQNEVKGSYVSLYTNGSLPIFSE